jgi:iron complex transport system substrate-binding protein
VSAFTSAKIDKILDLKPDVVFTFSDLQADVAAGLIRHGIELHAFNHPPGSSALRAHGH